ncbi:TPA: glycosyltransferase family 1 protein [Patescibacteria group bacterium]|nr:glycosyltransferase family 1 protein [Patescibacteria group bacterium]
MRIGVDIRGLLTGKWSGVEQYTSKVLEQLLRLDQTNTFVLFYVSYRDLDQKLAELIAAAPWLRQKNVEIRKLKWVNFPLLLHALWKPLNWPKADLICGGLGVMWQPSPRILPVSRRCRQVITFHDLVFELFPQFYTWKSRLWQWQMSYPYLSRTADQLIAVSRSTKHDLEKIYRVDPVKIQVIYEGIEPSYFIPVGELAILALKEKFNIPGRYLYYIGSLEPRKNVVAIVRTLAYLKTQNVNMKLVISGAKSWLEEPVFAEIEKLNLQQEVIFTGPVTESDKIAWLQGAAIFVFPSLYEGFGLPVLEAFAAGCPVVTSNVSSLPEVAGEAALLVDPNDQTVINEAVYQLCADKNMADELIKQGRERAKQFTWEKTAKETLNILLHGGK